MYTFIAKNSIPSCFNGFISIQLFLSSIWKYLRKTLTVNLFGNPYFTG